MFRLLANCSIAALASGQGDVVRSHSPLQMDVTAVTPVFAAVFVWHDEGRESGPDRGRSVDRDRSHI